MEASQTMRTRARARARTRVHAHTIHYCYRNEGAACALILDAGLHILDDLGVSFWYILFPQAPPDLLLRHSLAGVFFLQIYEYQVGLQTRFAYKLKRICDTGIVISIIHTAKKRRPVMHAGPQLRVFIHYRVDQLRIWWHVRE